MFPLHLSKTILKTVPSAHVFGVETQGAFEKAPGSPSKLYAGEGIILLWFKAIYTILW